MATTRKPKQASDLHTAILTFLAGGESNGELIQAGAQYPSDHPAVSLYPLHFAPTSGGQPAIDKASQALRADIDAAAANRELQWYGPKVDDQPTPTTRVIAVKEFTHRGQPVTLGSIWAANHEAVQSAPSAFAPVQD